MEKIGYNSFMEINTRLLSQNVNLMTIIEMLKSSRISKEKALTFLEEQIRVREEEIKALQILSNNKKEKDEV